MSEGISFYRLLEALIRYRYLFTVVSDGTARLFDRSGATQVVSLDILKAFRKV